MQIRAQIENIDSFAIYMYTVWLTFSIICPFLDIFIYSIAQMLPKHPSFMKTKLQLIVEFVGSSLCLRKSSFHTK